MALTEAQKRANQKYNAKSYDQIKVLLKKGQRDVLKKIALEQGVSLNEFINIAIKNQVNKNVPCFVFNLDKRIEVTNEQILIPIGIQNKTDIPVFHLQLCKYDDGKYIKVSDTQPEHDIYDYLSKDNASKDETVYFAVTCNEEVNGCDLRFCIKFKTSNGSCYKQEFRIQYSSVLYENGNKGAFTRNCFYGLPEPISD